MLACLSWISVCKIFSGFIFIEYFSYECCPGVFQHPLIDDQNELFSLRTHIIHCTFRPIYDYRRALDIGCAVGGATFELTRSFDEVVGIDFSHAFIDAANEMKKIGSKQYQMVIEGTITEPRMAQLPAGTNADRATFSQVSFLYIMSLL